MERGTANAILIVGVIARRCRGRLAAGAGAVMTAGERVGFAVMFAGMPIAASYGWPGVVVAVAGAGVLAVATLIRG